MNAAWIWFGLTAVALIGEVMTGTFYLLMVAIGFAVAGFSAMAGLELSLQIAICAAAVVLSTLLLRRLGVLKNRSATTASRNADVNMDIGQTLKVDAWSADRTARVWYRGSHWEAELAPGAPSRPGLHVITELRGSCLIVTPQN